MAQDKESFISSEQRPGVALNPDTPISELRIRDLQTLLQAVTFEKQKTWPEPKDRSGKPEKYETKNEWLEWKYDKEKYENDLVLKPNKEIKENKENEGSRPDGEKINPAAIDQLIRTISGLSEQVTSLTQEVEKLKQRSAGG